MYTALAVRLTDAGLGDYWDDVDAIARNQLSAPRGQGCAAEQGARRIAARIPSWVDRRELRADVSGREVALD